MKEGPGKREATKKNNLTRHIAEYGKTFPNDLLRGAMLLVAWRPGLL